MINLIVASLISAAPAFDGEAEALTKVRAFRDVAASAMGTYANSYMPAPEPTRVERTDTSYHFQFSDGGAMVRRSDHLITGFTFSPPDRVLPPDHWDEANAIGDAMAISLAEKYIVAFGEQRPCVLKYFSRERELDRHSVYVLTYVPSYQGIIYHPGFRIRLEIDYNTGRLIGFNGNAELPDAPASLRCDVTKESALFKLLNHIYNNFNVTVLNLGFEELVIAGVYRLPPPGEPHNFPQRVLDLLGTTESTLVYLFEFFEPSMGKPGKETVAMYVGLVDPLTGSIWYVRCLTPFGGGKQSLLMWDLGVGEISVSNGSQTLTVKNADVDRVPSPKSFTNTTKMTLRRAKLLVAIEYDSKSGLLRTSLGEAHSYGKPSENLKKALDKLTN